MADVIMIGQFKIKDGMQEEFGQVADRIMAIAGSTPGIKRYDWHANESGDVHAVEIYAGDDAMKAHLASEAGAIIPEVFQFADVIAIHQYGSFGEEVGRMLAGFPITKWGSPAYSPPA